MTGSFTPHRPLKIDAANNVTLDNAANAASTAEELGYDAIWSAETAHDPFLPLAVAAGATSSIDLGTSIAVAFARNLMTLASTSDDLQRHSRGRFMLGLGSQVEAHITKRFSMPWSKPAARMREMSRRSSTSGTVGPRTARSTSGATSTRTR